MIIKESKEADKKRDKKRCQFTSRFRNKETGEVELIQRCTKDANCLARCLDVCSVHFIKITSDNKYKVWHTNGKKVSNPDAIDNEDFYGSEGDCTITKEQEIINETFLKPDSTIRVLGKRDATGMVTITQEEYDKLQEKIKQQIQDAYNEVYGEEREL